ncbi:MAG: hypothetical protein U9N49_11315 [Campylobacterota bacterium]|nr:hypothetical protein [Campylobacterota bacterium]
MLYIDTNAVKIVVIINKFIKICTLKIKIVVAVIPNNVYLINNDTFYSTYIKFSKNRKQIITSNSDGTIKFTPLYRDRKLPNQYYPLEVEVESGTYLDPNTNEVKALSKEEWEAKKAKYDKIIKKYNP